jgi:hypothetical protein
MTFSEGGWFCFFGFFLLAGSEVGFAGFPYLRDLDEDAGDEPQE